MVKANIRKFFSGFFCVVFLSFSAFAQTPYTSRQDVDFLTCDELKTLSAEPHADGKLEAKLNRFFRKPVVSNEAFYLGAKPHSPTDSKIGKFLRIATWNIEKSIEMPRVIKMLTEKDEIKSMIDESEAALDSEDYKNILRQRNRLDDVDIWALQEIEIGMKRSNYLDAAREMAKALNMKYAYAPQFLEIDPVRFGAEKLLLDDGTDDQEAQDYYAEDPVRFKGVFGSAVLSRYPIKKAEVFPLENQGYDWYYSEHTNLSFLEKARRFGTKTIFKNEVTREMKVGGRGYFRVDLEVPGLPDNTLTVINIHLEIKCQPRERARQVEEILRSIKKIKNPVIMLGDFNAAPGDISPTSLTRVLGRTAKDPTAWLSLGISYISPQGILINTTRGASNLTKNFNDPFARHIKIIAPNKLKEMFDPIRKFRFDDGTTFDFRGDPRCSINGKDAMLANSNERGFKGFKTSFRFKRPLGIVGKFRLDWIFVKSGLLYSNEDHHAPYKLAPHFGETMEELNTSLKQPLSDHHPSVVDIPFDEPRF